MIIGGDRRVQIGERESERETEESSSSGAGRRKRYGMRRTLEIGGLAPRGIM